METDAAVCFHVGGGLFVLCFGVFLVFAAVNIPRQAASLFFPPSPPVVTVIGSSTTWKEAML